MSQDDNTPIQRRRNRQQAKRVMAEQFGAGGAGPIELRVTEDPALAPLTLTHPIDQADKLRQMMRAYRAERGEAA